MPPSSLKTILKTGLATSGIVTLYKFTDLLFVYHYFKYEYYIAGVAVTSLLTGILLAVNYQKNKLPCNTYNPLERLTAKELIVLAMISQGKANKEIAALNFVEVSTIKTHINNIYAKVEVKNRKDAIKMYQLHHFNLKSTLSPSVVI